MYRKNGFSLLELSIVLIIMSMLLTLGIESSKYILKQSYIKSTISKLQSIQNAIDIYLIQNGKLPCPAPLKNNSGEAVNTCNYNNEIDGIFYNNGIATGMVPFKDLNLTPDIVRDAWNNKITYNVLVDATNNIKNMNNDFDGIIIYNDNTTQTEITDKAIYTIISHGENQLGAYHFYNNTQNSKDNITEEENYNTPNNNSNIKIYFNNSKTKDDLLKYKTKMQIIYDNNIEDINCYIDNIVISNLIVDNNISSSPSFSLPSNNYLNFNEKIESNDNKFIIKCFKYGRLGIYGK